MMSSCDVTNSAHQIQMTTICHWMKPPMKIFCVRHWQHGCVARTLYGLAGADVFFNLGPTLFKLLQARATLIRHCIFTIWFMRLWWSQRRFITIACWCHLPVSPVFVTRVRHAVRFLFVMHTTRDVVMHTRCCDAQQWCTQHNFLDRPFCLILFSASSNVQYGCANRVHNFWSSGFGSQHSVLPPSWIWWRGDGAPAKSNWLA